MRDVERAIALRPAHLSHYQLTLEPNTEFAAHPPPLPDDDAAWAMQEACQAALANAGYAQYEVSAYAREGRRCAHNLNYWTFGDYLGIGAGAHGKITRAGTGEIRRRWKVKHPRAYLESAATPTRIGGDAAITQDDLPFEYMMNALRLADGVPLDDFSEHTGLPLAAIDATLRDAVARGWLADDPQTLRATETGARFLNDLVGLFLPEAPRRHA